MTEVAFHTVDARQLSDNEVAERLSQYRGEVAVKLAGLADRPLMCGLASGLTEPISLEVEGPVGDFFFLLGGSASVDVHGTAGICCAHSMVSGRLLVHGKVGDCAGAFATGGFLAVLGQAGHRSAFGLAGADVLIRSRVGDQAGLAMKSGVLVLGNGTGAQLGAGMQGGVIYVRGEVQSMAEHLRPTRMKDADVLRLSLMLARAGLKADAGEFKAFRVQEGKLP